jgi:hypothetical protein
MIVAASQRAVRPLARRPVTAARRWLCAAALAGAMSAALLASDGQSQQPVAAADGKLFSAIVRRQNPAIVSITTSSQGVPWDADEEEEFHAAGSDSRPPASVKALAALRFRRWPLRSETVSRPRPRARTYHCACV